MWPFNAKKRHFKKRLGINQLQTWDTQFQKERLKMLREDMRQQYDRVNENCTQMKQQLAPLLDKQNLTVEEALDEKFDIKKVKDENAVNFINNIKKYDPDLQFMVSQMKALDREIDGDDNPNSVQKKLEALVEVREMYKEHIKRKC